MKNRLGTLLKIFLVALIVFFSYPIVQDRVINKQETQSIIDKYFANENTDKSIANILLQMQGTLVIPRVDIELPVYTGTSEEVLSRGIGIIEGTGDINNAKGTNPILTSHNGSTESRLLINLEKVQIEDTFYTKTKDKVRQYKVIDKRVIEPIDELSKILEPSKDENYITIRTCTPINVNSHRLLVTGKEVPLVEEIPQSTLILSNFEKMMLSGASVSLLFLIVLVVRDNRKDTKCSEN